VINATSILLFAPKYRRLCSEIGTNHLPGNATLADTALMLVVQVDPKMCETLELLISQCGGIIASLRRIEHAAITNMVKWSLQAEITRVEELQHVLQRLADEAKTNTK
jgi:hypothetical protein